VFSIGFTGIVFADVKASIEVLSNHPQVLGERAKGLASDARVAQQSAQWLPNIAISTDGGKRIWGNASDTQARALRDNGYIDLVVTGRQLIYDFGVVDGYIEEAKLRSKADSYLDEIALNALVGDLVQLTLQYEVEQERSKIVVSLIVPLNQQSELSRQRYEAGVSGGDDYRRLEMDIDRLNRDQAEIQRRLRDLSQKIVEQFALSVEDAVELSDYLLAQSSQVNITTERISDRSRRFREQAASARIEAAVAERKPRFELELELRGFDVEQNLGSENELTGNLQMSMPFFDGGALKAKASVAEFERSVVQQEQAFETRVLRERTAQIEEEKRTLKAIILSLAKQRKTAVEALGMSLERQGRTAVEISQINTSMMSIYQIDSELLDARLRSKQLDLEFLTLNERGPSLVNQALLALEKK
jgi:outer membrane protein TolC